MTIRYSNTKFLTILDPLPLDDIGWEIQVISPTDWTTVLAYISRFESMMVSKVANDFGSGAVTLAKNDPVLSMSLPLGLEGTILDRECLYRCYQDGLLRLEWMGEDTQEDIVNEDGKYVTQISGRTTEKVLEWGVAVPGNITVMVDDPKDKKPADWEETHPGPSYSVTKKKIQGNYATLTLSTTHSIQVGDVVVVTGVDSTFNGKPTILQRTSTTITYKRVAANVAEVADTGTVQGPSPAYVPTQIPQEIVDPMEFTGGPAINALMWLIDNIQDRGTLSFLNLTFDATQDSEGQPWVDVTALQISQGETILGLLQRLSESLGWEFKMLTNFQLYIAQDGFGIHRENEIKQTIVGGQKEHTRNGSTRELATNVFAKAADGSVAQSAGSSEASPWKREKWLEAGDAVDISGASMVANASVGLLKDRQVGRTVQVVDQLPGRTFFVDYDVQDWITVEDEKIVPPAELTYVDEVVKILAATINIDTTLNQKLELTIQTNFEARAVKTQRMLDKLGAGSASTTSSKIITSSQTFSAGKIGDLSDVNAVDMEVNDLLQWDGSKWQSRQPDQLAADLNLSLDELADVDLVTTPPEAGDTLVYNDGLEMWVPGAGGGGGGGNPWLSRVDLPLTTLTGWTAGSGTWSASAAGIRQADTGNAVRRLNYDTVIDVTEIVLEATINIAAGPNSVSSRAGFVIGTPKAADGTGGILVALNTNNATATTGVNWEHDAITAGPVIALGASIPYGTDIRFRVHVAGSVAAAYVDGTLVGTAVVDQPIRDHSKFALYSYATDATFKNLNVWTTVAPDETSIAVVGQDRRWVVGANETSIDEFNDESLNPAWVRVDGTGALATSVTWEEGADSLVANHTATADTASFIHALLRPLASIGGAPAVGDAFVTALTLQGHPGANYTMGGLVLADGTTFGAGLQIITLNFLTGNAQTNDCRAFNTFKAQTAASTARVTPAGAVTFVRLVRVTSTTWRCDLSSNGTAWTLGASAVTHTITPTHVGLLSSNWGGAVAGQCSYEFLRRVSGIA